MAFEPGHEHEPHSGDSVLAAKKIQFFAQNGGDAMAPPVKVLALSGSLRAASINTALLRAAAQLAPDGMQVQVYQGLGELALFNLDLEPTPPDSVRRLRKAVTDASALVIASPEYAHGVSGVMKNALDWLVSLEAFYGKPVAVWNAQPRARFADDALRETLGVMSASIVAAASVAIQLNADTLTESGMLACASVSGTVTDALVALQKAVAAQTAA